MEIMTAHKFIAMMLVCGILAPFESDAQSACMTLAESDSVGSELLARVGDYVLVLMDNKYNLNIIIQG
jgi:hypothetical protein